RCWSELIERIRQKTEQEIGEIQEGRLLKEELQKAFAEMEKLEIHHTPPFTLKLLLVRIPEEVEKEVDELSEKIQEKIQKEDVLNVQLEKETLFFYEGLIKLKEKERSFRVRGKGVLASNLPQCTQELYSKGETYNYCTVCGELPAVLRIPRRRTAEREGETCYEDLIPEKYRPFFDEGEHLCPYCLIKRLASTIAEPEFLRLFLRKETRQRRIKSVSWYCVYPFMKALTDERLRLEDLEQLLQDYAREIEKQDIEELTKNEAKKIIEILKGEFESDGRKPYVGGGEKALQELGQISFEPLLAIGISEKILAKVEEKTRSRPRFAPYFSLIQADADDIGKVLSGRVGGILLKSDPEFFATIALKVGATAGLEKYRQIIGELLSVFPSEEGEAIKCWPSLLFTVSTGLMIGALKDHAEAQKAGPACIDLVYAGGDDLLAVAPVTEALWYVQITRSTFSMEETRSFHELWMRGNIITKIPSMGKCTRSYSVVFSHYHAPLAPALENLRRGLDTAKNTEQTVLVEQRKDSLFLGYSPRGGAGVQTVIGTRHVGQLLNLLEGLKKGVFTMSLVRDLAVLVEKYERLLGGEPEYQSLVRYTAERNVPRGKEGDAEVLITLLCQDLQQKIMRPRLLPGEKEKLGESLLAAMVRALRVGVVAMREEVL
ncbi:MAG: type III-B CRISPR-associated protein Cas10/Cmr2, partial [Candidatus Hadarchaeales archaeon]